VLKSTSQGLPVLVRIGRSHFVTDAPRSTLTVVTFVVCAAWFVYVIWRALTRGMAWTPDLTSSHIVSIGENPKTFWLGVAWAAAMLVVCGLGAAWVWASDRNIIQMTDRRARRS
jgi:hypothetical protein